MTIKPRKIKKRRFSKVHLGTILSLVIPFALWRLIRSVSKNPVDPLQIPSPQDRERVVVPSAATQHQSLISIPGAKSIVINVGSNGDPILPKKSDGPCAVSLAVEPVVPHLIRQHPQVHVLPAAVSNVTGLASMFIYNNNGVSSSLAKSSQQGAAWSNNKGRGDGKTVVVATVSFATLLKSIPNDIEIKYIRTDMQGYDFMAFQSLGNYAVERGIPYIEVEAFPYDSDQYEGVQNDLCRDWMPYMKRLGYVFEGAREENDMVKEFVDEATAMETCQRYLAQHPERGHGPKDTTYYNAMFRLNTVPAAAKGDFEAYNYPNLPRKGKRKDASFVFTKEEYESCLL